MPLGPHSLVENLHPHNLSLLFAGARLVNKPRAAVDSACFLGDIAYLLFALKHDSLRLGYTDIV